MFSQLLFVRLRAAEKALRQERIDEAYRLAASPDLRSHKRAKAVLGALADRFIERARTHFHEDRFEEALSDLDRAAGGDNKFEEIADLRQHIHTVAKEVARRDKSRRDRINAAIKRVEGGSLAAARRIIDHASIHDAGAREYREALDNRGADAARMIEKAEKLIEQGHYAEAASTVRRVRSADSHDLQIGRIESMLCEKVFALVRSAVGEGRLSRAADELACLGEVGAALPEKRELADLLAIARAAGDGIRSGDYAEARRRAMMLKRLLPSAKWVKDVAVQLERIDDIRTELCAGPLGERISDKAVRDTKPGLAAALDDTVALPNRAKGDDGLPDRLLVLVDGGGSYLLLRGDRLSIGRVAASKPADVAIFSDIAERHADIARVEDDYFIHSERGVEVAGRKTHQQLLRDGDRIVLGRKAKFTFRKPSRKSPSAILDLSETTKMPNDVRRVVLFQRHAIIGGGPTAHMHCRHASPPLVLFERDGGLWVRPQSDGHVDTTALPLPLGVPTEIAGISMVVAPYVSRTPGDRVV